MSLLPTTVSVSQLLAGSFAVPWSALSSRVGTVDTDITNLCLRLSLPYSFVKHGQQLAVDIYKLCFATAPINTFYHNLGHSQVTLLHALRIYAGSLACNHRLDLQEIKLLTLTCLLHEVDDWWTRGIPDQKPKIALLVSKFLYLHQIDPVSFRKLLSQANFNAVASPDFLTTILHGADFCQCLDHAYLHPVKLSDLPDQPTSLGPLVLASEFCLLRPKALVSAGWDLPNGQVNWSKVGTDLYFFRNYFLPNFNPVLPWLDAFYTAPSKNPYRRQLHQLEQIVNAS